MELTLVGQVLPGAATPGTSACPPSLPFVPTSRATRVTSAANERKLLHHGVERFLELENFAAYVHGDLA